MHKLDRTYAVASVPLSAPTGTISATGSFERTRLSSRATRSPVLVITRVSRSRLPQRLEKSTVIGISDAGRDCAACLGMVVQPLLQGTPQPEATIPFLPEPNDGQVRL